GASRDGMMQATVGKIPVFLILCLFSVTAAAGVAVGDSPELKARAVDGRDVDLSTLRGKLVLVDFWIGRTEANHEDEKKLAAIFKDYHEKGLEIIGICC